MCRKRAWRFRRAVPAAIAQLHGTRPGSIEDPRRDTFARFAYADPPYPGDYDEREEVDR